MYICLGKTWAETPPLRQYRIISIFRKRVVKQAIGGRAEDFEIVAISNQYKDTLDDLNDSSDPESPDWARPINEKSCNAPISKGSSIDLSERDCLDENLPTDYYGWHLRLETHRYINVISLHHKQYMGRVRGGEKIVGKIK